MKLWQCLGFVGVGGETDMDGAISVCNIIHKFLEMAAFGNNEVSYFTELRNFTWSIKLLSCRLVDTVQFLSDWNTWAKLVASSYTITQDALLLSKCLFEGILLFLNFAMWISKGTFSTSEVRMQFPNAANVQTDWLVPDSEFPAENL